MNKKTKILKDNIISRISYFLNQHPSTTGNSLVESLIAVSIFSMVGLQGFSVITQVINKAEKNVDKFTLETDVANDIMRFFNGVGNLQEVVDISPNRPLNNISGKKIPLHAKDLAGQKFFYKPGLYSGKGQKLKGESCPKSQKGQCFSVSMDYTIYCLNPGSSTRCNGSASDLGNRVFIKFSANVNRQNDQKPLLEHSTHVRYTYTKKENEYVQGASSCGSGNSYPIGLNLNQRNQIGAICEIVDPTHISRLLYQGPRGPTGIRGQEGPRGPRGPDGMNCAGQLMAQQHQQAMVQQAKAVTILASNGHQVVNVSNGSITAVDQKGRLQTFPAKPADATSFAARGGGCFVSGSLIRMANGDLKPIEELKKGDEILNGITGEVSVFARGVKGPEFAPVYEFSTATGSLAVTEAHPMYTTRGLVPANAVQINDKLLSESGEYIAIEDIKLMLSEKDVYNIELKSLDGTDVPGGLISSGIVTGDLDDQEKLQKTMIKLVQMNP